MIEDLNNICESIRMHSCPSCGGHYNKSTCVYCGLEDEELMHAEAELTDMLEHISEFNTEMLLSLYSIRKFNIDKVTEILNKYNFENYLNNKNNEIINKKGNYTDEDHKLLLYFASNNLYDKRNSLNILVSELVKDKLNMSTEDKLKIIKLFVSNLVEIATKYKPRVSMNNDNEKIIGSSFYGFLDFNENQIKKWLEEKEYIEILKTVFHECTHSLQKSKMRKPLVPTYYLLLESKEEIIRNYIDNYYDDNYLLYSHEVEARLKAIYETIAYLEFSGIEVPNKDKMLEEANEEMMLSTIEDRKVNGNTTNANDLFDSLLPNIRPEFLANFPMIGLEYKLDNGILVKKTKEELDFDYNNLVPHYQGEEKQELDRLYSFLYNRLNKKITNQL